MANPVSITFSAQIGQLISGVDQVKSAISSIAAPVNQLAGLFTGLGEGFAGVFAVDQVAAFVSQMEDLGTQTLRTSAMLGVSTTEAQQLGFIAKATGGSADSLALSMERLQLNLARAQSGIGPAAQALQALGLSTKDLIGQPIDEQMNRIADALSRFADGGNKTAIVLALLGRSGAEMIPVLDKGRAGLDELRQSAQSASAIVSGQTIAALDRAGTSAIVMRSAMTALGETIVAQFAPALITLANKMTTLIGNFTLLTSAGNVWRSQIEGIEYAIASLAIDIGRAAQMAADFFHMDWAAVKADWQAGTAAQEKLLDDHLYRMGVLLLESKAKLQEGLAPPAATLSQAPALPVPNTAAINAAMAAAAEQIKLADEVYTQMAEKLGSELKLHQITYGAETQALLSALDQRRAAELAAVAQEASVGGLSVAQAQKIANEKLQIDQKYAQDRQRVLDKAAQDEAKEWESRLSTIEGAWNSQLRGLLGGTETWGQAMKKIAGDLVINFIENAEKIVGNWIAGELTKTTATTAGVAARTAAEQGGASVSLATQLAANLKAIGSDAAKVFADVFAYLAPALGPFAAAPAAAASALVLGAETLMPSADVGGYVVSDGLAMIHANETILPARIDQPYWLVVRATIW